MIRQPKDDAKHEGRQLYALEIVHRRHGILEGGGGHLFVEDPEECSEWFRLLRRHCGHHEIHNVFRFSGDGEGVPSV